MEADADRQNSLSQREVELLQIENAKLHQLLAVKEQINQDNLKKIKDLREAIKQLMQTNP